MQSLSASEKEEIKTLAKDNWNNPLFLAILLFKTNPGFVRCDGALYNFNGKCYDLVEDAEIDSIFLNFCLVNDISKSWKFVTPTLRAFYAYDKIPNVEKMNDYPGLLCLNNGILNIYTKEFLPHSPLYYFDSVINVDYDAEATECPVFKKYLFDTFNGDQDTIRNIIRLGGYLFDTSCDAEKMFLFDGSGANGKSVLIKTYSMFFTKDQISPLSLDTLASQSFSKELLVKARVNFCAEQKKAFLDSEEIKKLITGDKIEINRKFKIALTIDPKVKIISASNGLPKFNDTTHAIYRRILIVKFPNQYLSDAEYAKVLHPERSHVFLKDKTILDGIYKEKSSILNLFVEGLIELKEDSYNFIESKSASSAMEEFKRDSDSVREFLQDNYEVSDDKDIKTSLSQVYEHYRQWYSCNISQSIAMKFRKNEMGKRIREIFGVESFGQEYIYNGITQRSERETMYPIRLLTPPPIEGEIITPEEAKQQNINF